MQKMQEVKPTHPKIIVLRPDLRKLRPFYWAAAALTSIILVLIGVFTQFHFLALLISATLIVPMGLWLHEWRKSLSSSVYTITPEYVEAEASESIFGRQKRRLPIAYIRNITINVSQLQQQYGLSSITVRVANGDSITLEDIQNGETIRETIWQLVRPYTSS